jgi:hypothetical protein
MGRLNRGPNGPFSGKAGSIIGSSWRDIYYIKGLQKKSTNPRSQAQIAQQNKFAFAVKFLRPVKVILDMGFSRINPGGATGYNMAISHTVQNAIKGSDPDYEIDYPSVVLCTKGKLALPGNIQMELDGINLRLTWDISTSPYASSSDLVEILIHQPGTSNFQTGRDGIPRGSGQLQIKLSDHYQGDTVHVYIYLMSASKFQKQEWSDSVYLGAVKFR